MKKEVKERKRGMKELKRRRREIIDNARAKKSMNPLPDPVEYNRVYNAIFNRRMYLTRLVYRVPFFILEFIMIALFTLAIPIIAGLALVAGMKIIQAESPLLMRFLGYWFLGLVTIGGAGMTVICVVALWSALKDSAVRLLKLIREKREK